MTPTYAPDDLEACQTIVRGLPDFFTDDVPDKIANDLDAHHGWVITKDEGVVGFAVVEYRPSRAAEILWMAARHDQRNQGRRDAPRTRPRCPRC